MSQARKKVSAGPGPNTARLRAAASAKGVHEDTLRRMIKRGELTGYRLGPRLIMIDLDELDNVLRPIPTANAS